MPLEPEPIETDDPTVKCEGGGLPLGHPRIYLNLKEEGKVICPYCSQVFIQRRSPSKEWKKPMQLKNKKLILFLSAALMIGGAHAQKAQLTNPASMNCIQSGGELLITKRGDGGDYGICVFEDNLQCEEWALLRKDCPMGGIKITGYSTPEAIYCALKGGKVLEGESQCVLPSGKKQSTKDLYNGKCCS